MKPVHHVLISTGVSALFWSAFKSVPATAVCFLSGIFIDIDHHLDYWFVRKKFPWNYGKMKDYFFSQKYRGGPLYLIFHAYEWLILLWGFIFIGQPGIFWQGLGVGLTTHMIADLIYNPIKPYGYFITYRFLRHFNSERILKPRG